MNVLSACMYAYHVYVPGSYRGQKQASDPSRSGVTYGCELPCGCWEPDLDPLEEEWPLTQEPSLQPLLLVLRQALGSNEPALNSSSSCHHLPSAEITGTCHQGWLRLSIFKGTQN